MEQSQDPVAECHRILVVDDNRAIHEDIQKVLRSKARNTELDALEAMLFEDDVAASGPPPMQEGEFILHFASQGKEAYELVKQSIEKNERYSVAFVDMRMPPGWDGLETIEHLWQVDPDIQTVICTAFSDHGWEDITRRLQSFDKLLIIKKPFDNVEVLQAAHNLSHKWSLGQTVKQQVLQLNGTVAQRTEALQAANQDLLQKVDQLQRMETELRLAQKLEGVGQLAAGIAHEINTPSQFVSDNLSFLETSLGEITQVLGAYEAVQDGSGSVEALEALKEELDLDYLLAEVPTAIGQSLDGMRHIARIVMALKQFCHPGTESTTRVDINAALETTLTVSRNEWKYTAEVIQELDPDLPNVLGLPGELNQVFLNLIVNASHAMLDKQAKDADPTGKLTLKTKRIGDCVEVQIGDTGGGIPEAIAQKVFDPFFTTKEVGKGTGQGLAIARSVVVNKHGGNLRFESTPGEGTIFFITLPIEGKADTANDAQNGEKAAE